MKTPIIITALLTSIAAGAQTPGTATQTTATQTAAGQTALPAPTSYRVVGQGANHRVWERTIYERAPDGRIVPRKNQYTELAAGMHYWSNGQWVESREQIETYPQGAIARQGQHQVIFANNLNSAGAIDVQTPDGKRLRSNVLGLGYYDSATRRSVLIAQIQDSQGQLISANRVLYPNAFAGVKADVRYTYKKGSFEQDVILREQPPAPEAFGLNAATTELEVMTEFLNPPPAAVRNRNGQNNNEVDQEISWGAMQLGQGRAFDLGGPKNVCKSAAVRRRYEKVEGRDILLEVVPVKDIQASLNKLPLQAGASSKLPALASKTLALPKTPLEQADQKPIQMASAAPSNQGYVLDYVLIEVNQAGYTFQGDTTYLISGDLNFSGAVTFEGGTVIKYAGGSSITVSGAINCQTEPYRPAFFTSWNDDTIGEHIDTPLIEFGFHIYNYTGYDLSYFDIYDDNWTDLYSEWGEPLLPQFGEGDYQFDIVQGQHLNFQAYDTENNFYEYDFSPNSADGYLEIYDTWYYYSEGDPMGGTTALAISGAGAANIHDVVIRNLDYGISTSVSSDYSVDNAQFVGVGDGLTASGTGHGFVTNCLFTGGGEAFSVGAGAAVSAWNVTVDNIGGLTSTLDATAHLTLNYSLIVAVPNTSWRNSAGLSLVNTPDLAGSASSAVFTNVAGGWHYLKYDTYRNLAPASDYFRQLTTRPPLSISGTLADNTSLAPRGLADTGSVDLGYHYPVLDYVATGVNLNGKTLNLQDGVALGVNTWGYPKAICVNGGGALTSTGRPDAMNRMVGCSAVQEAASCDSSILFLYVSMPSTLNLNFTDLLLDQGAQMYVDPTSGSGALTLQNCRIRGGSENFYLGNNAGVVSVANNLFERASPCFSGASTSLTLGFFNNLVKGGTLTMSAPNNANSLWQMSDNLLDGCSTLRSGTVTRHHNGFTAGTATGYFCGSSDVTGLVADYQPGPLGNYYYPATGGAGSLASLINAGSRTADAAGLYHFTTQTSLISLIEEADSIVDIGYHYSADMDGDGLPDWWEWHWFGNYNHSGYDMDSQGNWLLTDYQKYTNGITPCDPNVIIFTLSSKSNHVNTTYPNLQVNITAGVPSYYSVLVDSTNFDTANWTAYSSSSITANLGANEGWHDVWIGLKGLPSEATRTWQWRRLKLDTTPPHLTITNPTNGTVKMPMIQLTGYSPEALTMISYDLSNAVAVVTNQQAFITDQTYTTNTWEFVTNYFQCYDVPLTNGVNIITLHARDLAGNTTTTNFSFTVDYSNKPAPVVGLYWPRTGAKIGGSQFPIVGQLDDYTATVTATLTDANGLTNSLNGVVERDGRFWVDNVPFVDGTNVVTLTIKDVAGNIVTTSLTNYPSTVTINGIWPGDLWQPSIDVCGEINGHGQSTDGYSVWVNGVEMDTEDGYWYGAVPGTPGGVAIFNVTAYPPGENPMTALDSGDGSGGGYQNPSDPNAAEFEFNLDKPSRVYMKSDVQNMDSYGHWQWWIWPMNSTDPADACSWGKNSTTIHYDLTWNDGHGGGGSSSTLGVNADSTPSSSSYLCTEQMSWPGSVMDSGSGTFGGDCTSNPGVPQTIQPPPIAYEHCEVSDPVWPLFSFLGHVIHFNSSDWEGSDNDQTYVRHAQTQMALDTGGRAVPGLENLFLITGSAQEVLGKRAVPPYYVYYPENFQTIPPETVTVGELGQLDNEGKLLVVLPEGATLNATPETDKDFYLFGVGATKYKSHFTVFVNMPDPPPGTNLWLGELWNNPATGHAFWALSSDAPSSVIIRKLREVNLNINAVQRLNVMEGYGFTGNLTFVPYPPPPDLISYQDAIYPSSVYNTNRAYEIGFDSLLQGLDWAQNRKDHHSSPYSVLHNNCTKAVEALGAVVGVPLPDTIWPEVLGYQLPPNN